MVEHIKEIGGHFGFQPLCDRDVLEDREVLIPGSRTTEEISRVPVQVLPHCRLDYGPIREPLWKPVVKGGPQRLQHALGTVERYQALQPALIDGAGNRGIEVAAKPKALPAAKNVHLEALIRAKRRIAEQVQPGADPA